MSEERKLYKLYRPRLQIPITTMTSDEGQWAFYCLPVDGAQALLRIAPYLKRAITYIGEYVDAVVFKGPTPSEMEAVVDLVGQLEVALMAGCELPDVVEAIDRNTSAIQALQCICENLAKSRTGSIIGPGTSELVDEGRAYPGVSVPDRSITSGTDEEACAIAQLYWAWTFEVITETLLPVWDAIFDDYIPLLAAIIGEIVGPAPGDGIPIYALAELIQELFEVGYAADRENYINWLYAVQQEWICISYLLIKEGSTSTAIAQAVKTNLIDPAADISFGDKTVAAFIGGPWAVNMAKKAYENATQWALDNVDAGVCDDCEEDPICQALDCTPGNWDLLGAGDMRCDGGFPYAYDANPIRWIGTAPTQTTADFRLTVTWRALGTLGGIATLGCKLVSRDTTTHIDVAPPDTQPNGETKTSQWDLFQPATVGEDLLLQTHQLGWWAVIEEYCIEPL